MPTRRAGADRGPRVDGGGDAPERHRRMPGPSGWGFNYLSVLVEDSHCVEAMALFTQFYPSCTERTRFCLALCSDSESVQRPVLPPLLHRGPLLPPSRPLLPSLPAFVTFTSARCYLPTAGCYLQCCPLLPTIVPVVTLSVAPCYLDCRLLLPSSDTRLSAVCCHSDSRRLRCCHSPLALPFSHTPISLLPFRLSHWLSTTACTATLGRRRPV